MNPLAKRAATIAAGHRESERLMLLHSSVGHGRVLGREYTVSSSSCSSSPRRVRSQGPNDDPGRPGRWWVVAAPRRLRGPRRAIALEVHTSDAPPALGEERQPPP